MNNYTIYMHVCPNNKIYIGQTCQKPSKRWSNGYGYHNNSHFQNAIKLYGWNNIKHIILKENLTKEEADLLEIQYIEQYKSNDRQYGYNITKGGDGALGRPMNEKTKQKISKSNSGKNNANSKKLICFTTNKIFNCITDAAKYYNIDSSAISKCCSGKHRTAGKLSDGTKLIWRYLDNNNQIIEPIQKSNKYKSVICLTTQEIFYTMADACKKYNLYDGNLSKHCKGKQKSCGKLKDGTPLIWSYIEIIDL